MVVHPILMALILSLAAGMLLYGFRHAEVVNQRLKTSTGSDGDEILNLIGLPWRILAKILSLFGLNVRLDRGVYDDNFQRALRNQRGFVALTKAMDAISAGDANDAARWAKTAIALLPEQSLALLLAAQASQLQGDDEATEQFYKAMLETPNTRFLGLRGLVMQSLHHRDYEHALNYLREARRLRPAAPWALSQKQEVEDRLKEVQDQLTTVYEFKRSTYEAVSAVADFIRTLKGAMTDRREEIWAQASKAIQAAKDDPSITEPAADLLLLLALQKEMADSIRDLGTRNDISDQEKA